MKKSFLKGKSSRTKIFTLISVLLIVFLLAANLALAAMSVFGTVFVDMTPEGLYTLRDIMKDACRDVFVNEDGSLKEKGITITFCNDPDYLISDSITRAVYYMALDLSREYPNFEVKCVNVDMDPTSVAMYKTTSLSEINSRDVIISYGSRYRVTSAESFFKISGDKVYSFDGEYKLASILMSLTLVNQPAAYFVTDHGEDYYDKDNEATKDMGYFADLLSERGLTVKALSLSALAKAAAEGGTLPTVPDDCALLIINNPKTDFISDSAQHASLGYVSETEILDRYLTAGKGAIMVAKDYKISLPNLEDFLAEWGIRFSDSKLRDEENYIIDESRQNGDTLVLDYSVDEEGYAYQIYGEYASLSSSPRMILPDTGYISCSYEDSESVNESGTPNISRIYDTFLKSSDKAADYAYSSLTGGYDARVSEPGAKTVAAICGRQDFNTTTTNSTFSYLFCAASAEFFSAEVLGNTSYANYDIVSALVHNIARLDTLAPDELGGYSPNNAKGFLGKMLMDTSMSDKQVEIYEYDDEGYSSIVKINAPLTEGARIAYCIVIALVPTAILIVLAVVVIKRKFL